MEKQEERFIKWVLGVEERTPGYMVREEVQKVKQRGRAGRRAWRFEKRLESGRGSDVARICLENLKEKIRKGRSFVEMGRGKEELLRRQRDGRKVEERKNGENNWSEELEDRDREGKDGLK